MEWRLAGALRCATLIVGWRSSRVAAGIVAAALLFAGWATPARSATDTRLSLSVSPRWSAPGKPGAWTAYVVKARNDGTATFNGEVRLVPNPSQPGRFPPFQSVPQYRTAVSVAGGTERETSMYVIEPPGGYHAELRDEQGGVVLRADPPSAPNATAAVAVLSDARQVAQRIDAPLKALTGTGVAVTQFASAQAFPTNAVYLSGLNGVVIDEFSSAALSPSQVRALEDFVGLGGALILVGGASWRRVILPLPDKLLPLRPTATASASLAPMAELVGLASSAVVQVATGEVASWARVTVASPEGQPLLVEGRHGAGRIVALTFDPLVQPLDTQLDLAAVSWSQAISRALSGTLAGSQNSFGGAPPPGGLRGSGPGSSFPFPGLLQQALGGMPAPSPPFGLLALLLVGYGLIVTVVSYAVLRRAGRRGLLWVTAPALAIAFTAGAYWVGFGTRGSDYQATAVQTLRLGPDGVVETFSFAAIAAPRRGDLTLMGQPDSLISTAVMTFGPNNLVDRDAVITLGPQPQVLLASVPVWDVRPVQTLGVARRLPTTGPTTAMPIDATLRLESGRIKGEVVNHTARTIRDVQLVHPSGTGSQLVRTLAPGATAPVDVAATAATPALAKGGVVFNGAMQGGPGIAALAAGQAISGPGDLALVASTDPVETLRVNGQAPAGSTRAVLVEPVVLQSADSLSGLPP